MYQIRIIIDRRKKQTKKQTKTKHLGIFKGTHKSAYYSILLEISIWEHGSKLKGKYDITNLCSVWVHVKM